MDLVRYEFRCSPRWATVVDGELVDLAAAWNRVLEVDGVAQAVARSMASGLFQDDLAVLMASGDKLLRVGEAVSRHVRLLAPPDLQAWRDDRIVLPLAGQALLPPVAGSCRVFCVGKNFADHVEEARRIAPAATKGATSAGQAPTIFLRTHASFVGHNAALLVPTASSQLDWEVELGVVIGRAGRAISREDALGFVAGYTVVNDGSVRDYQFLTAQNTPGKNFDRSGSMGPWIRTVDSVQPGSRELTTSLNGSCVQKGNTADMLHDVASLITFISQWVTLQPGDLISTGTPAGVGASRVPPRWLRPGDRLEFRIAGVGELVNVVHEESRAPLSASV
jgi:2-keto-4-pentenoate hydratase/2-oxohepta-3-ene-1,7-dioic acid hydratase in catechol pathway